MDSAKLKNKKQKKADADERLTTFLRQYGGTLLGLLLLALLVHDIFGTHGYLAMRRTQQEINKVKTNIEKLNKENARLEEEVKELKSDPHKIERIARDELGLARPGEVIIKIPQSQQLPQDSFVKP
jgi:cell division protein FtsB